MRKILTAMTDAEKLRLIANGFINSANQAIFIEQEDATLSTNLLIKVADFLDAVPPETLAALKAGTMVVIGRGAASIILGWLQSSLGEKPSWGATSYTDAVNAVRMLQAALAAAPAKPEE